MKLETGNWKLVAVLAVLSGLSVQAGPLGIQRMEEIEATDTVLNDGELAAIKTATDPATVQLRYGDGETAGGIIVADPYSIKSAYHRALARSEYSAIMTGNCTYSNGTYTLLTERVQAMADNPANVGSLILQPRADLLFSGVSYSQNATWANVAVANNPPYPVGTTSITFTASESDALGNPMAGDVTARIRDITVYGWVGTHLIGRTNDCRGTMLLVRRARTDDEALNLGEHNRLMRDHRAENWSAYAATQQVNLAWQDLILTPYCKMTGTEHGADIALTKPNGATATNAISIYYAGRACTIVGYRLTATNATLWVEASITMTNAPVIQSTTSNLLTAVWANRATTSTWPTETWYTASSGKRFQTWTLTAPRTAGAAQEYFRVSGSPNASDNHVTINLPLRPAAGITLGGVTVTTWAELKTVLEALP
jgi:hypothetical protein